MAKMMLRTKEPTRMTTRRSKSPTATAGSPSARHVTPPSTPMKLRPAVRGGGGMSPTSPAALTCSLTSGTTTCFSPQRLASDSPFSSAAACRRVPPPSLDSSSSSLQIPILADDAFVEDLEHLILQSDSMTDDLAVRAAQGAQIKVDEFVESTKLKLSNGSQPVSLTWDDVTVHKLLGVGGFCCVTLASIEKIQQHQQQQQQQQRGRGRARLDSLEEEEEEEETENNIRDLSRLRRSFSPPAGKYALKCLNKTSVSSPKKFVRAAQGLAYEASMLSRLHHKNIIRIHGVCGSTDASTFRGPGGYFIVLQCMRRTLDDVLRMWRKREDSAPDVDARMRTIAVGIAEGMAYLHSKNIVFRDLKPHNVGIDFEGNPRIFDFGIAKELQELEASDYDANGRPTKLPIVKGCVGSLRYMAPEVLVQHQSSYPSDVYSYAVLLWQICTLKKPYGSKMNTASHFRQQVGRMNVRPSPMPEDLDATVKRIITAGWSEQPYKRPTFPQIIRLLDRAEAPVSPATRRRMLSKLVPSFLKTTRKTSRRTAPTVSG